MFALNLSRLTHLYFDDALIYINQGRVYLEGFIANRADCVDYDLYVYSKDFGTASCYSQPVFLYKRGRLFINWHFIIFLGAIKSVFFSTLQYNR
jgi:hypothetical protein